MKLHNNYKKVQKWNHNRDYQFADDDIQLSGKKGGKVMRQRKEERQIDVEMRNYYTYR